MYTQDELLNFLNYDTNTRPVFSYIERVLLHKGIAATRNCKPLGFSLDLQEKLERIKLLMHETKWRPAKVRIGQDRIAYIEIESKIITKKN